MSVPKVYNMTSPRTGKAVANQHIIDTIDDEGNAIEVFKSYDSIIAMKTYLHSGAVKITLDGHYWDYSKTTGKYRNEFLGEGIAETRKKIKSGEYSMEELN